MLRILRDNLKYLSWILWIVILVFVAFVFVDFGGGLATGNRGANDAAVTLGDQKISYRSFEREYKRLEQQYRDAFKSRWSSEMAQQLRLPQQALERLVNRELVAEEARRAGIRVSDAAVRDAILKFPALTDASGNFVGEATYDRFLRAYGYTPAEFEAGVRQDLMIQRFSALLEAGIVVPDSAVERSWRQSNEKVSVRYLLAPSSRYEAQATPNDAELQSYFAAHKEDFRLPDQRVVDYLLVDVAKLRATIQVSPSDIAQEYAERKKDFSTPEQVHARHILVKIDANRSAEQAKKLMAEIRAKLAKGEDFASLAKQYSEDPGSKDRGGDLGTFGKGAMVPAFDQAAFAAKPGEIVGPIQTSFGLHLIQVLEHEPARVRPLEEVESQIRAKLAAERAENLAKTQAEALADRIAKQKPGSEEAWKGFANGDTVVPLTTPKFGKRDPVPGIGVDRNFTETAFALAAPGDVSQAVKVPRGYAILRLKEIVPAHLPKFSEVEAKVRAAAEHDKAQQLAAADLDRARAQLAGGRSLDEVAKSLGLDVKDSGEFSRGGSIPGLGAAPALAEAALKIDVGAVGGPVVIPQGAVIFQVTAKTPFDAAKFAQAKDDLRGQLRRTEMDRVLGSLIEQRRAALGVRYDPTLLAKISSGTFTG